MPTKEHECQTKIDSENLDSDAKIEMIENDGYESDDIPLSAIVPEESDDDDENVEIYDKNSPENNSSPANPDDVGKESDPDFDPMDES